MKILCIVEVMFAIRVNRFVHTLGKSFLYAAIISLCLPGNPAYAQERNHWFEVKGGSWKPDTTILAELKKQIVPAAQKAAKARGQKLRPWREYNFQYQGMEENKRRYILVNAFCSFTEKTDLSENWLVFMDGGACFFSGKYDPEKEEFFDFGTNGEA